MFSKNLFYRKEQGSIKIIIVLVIVILIGVGLYYYFLRQTPETTLVPESGETTEEPATEPEIALVYPGALKIATPPEVETRVLLFYPEAEIATYICTDSREEIEGWYTSELTAEGWQEVEGFFQEWEKDGILLGTEIIIATEEDAEEMGLEEG